MTARGRRSERIYEVGVETGTSPTVTHEGNKPLT